MDRIQTQSEGSNVFALTQLVLATRLPTQPQAIAVCPGLGETERVVHAAIERQHRSVPYLLITGINPKEKTFVEYSREYLEAQHLIKKGDDRFYSQLRAEHTLEQAEWLVATVHSQGINSVEVHASWYHVTRAYLTVLATMLRSGRQFKLTAHATNGRPFEQVPEVGKAMLDMVAGEYQRILAYQEKGDVATLEQLVEYLEYWF